MIQVQLGILALARGRPEEARALLEEGLELSLATHSTRNVTLCLTAFAQLAFAQGEGERAALLAGCTIYRWHHEWVLVEQLDRRPLARRAGRWPGRTSNKITRWPPHITTPRTSTPNSHTTSADATLIGCPDYHAILRTLTHRRLRISPITQVSCQLTRPAIPLDRWPRPNATKIQGPFEHLTPNYEFESRRQL